MRLPAQPSAPDLTEQRLAALRDDVNVQIDRWGVPHITGGSREDAYRAQGYLHAIERGWQMEFLARAARGRLAEVLGEDALESDRLTRTLCLPQAAAAAASSLDAACVRILEPYAEGVLAGDAVVGATAEHEALGIAPEWRRTVDDVVLDACAIAMLVAFRLSDAWRRRLVRYWAAAELAADAGPDPARAQAVWAALSPTATAFGGASNAFAIAGRLTERGDPLLAGDPHLNAQAPSHWMLMHLRHPTVAVSGASMPGLPNVIMGRNEHVAWALTSSQADVADVYAERVDEERGVYLHKGEWIPLEVRADHVAVRGGATCTHQVRTTVHGPILASGLLAPDAAPGVTEALSLRWAHAEIGHDQTALEMVNEATDWTSFRAGLRRWRGAGQVVVYADTHGRIAAQMAGPVPLRTTSTPAPRVLCGWSGDDEWTGWIEFDALPADVDPESGIVVAANHAPPGTWEERGPTGQDWDWSARADRIAELLAACPKASVTDLVQVQLDTTSPLAARLRPALLRARPVGDAARRALEVVRAWDLHMATEAEGAAVFHMWSSALRAELFGPRLADATLQALHETRVWWTPWGVALLLDAVARLSAPELERASTAALESALALLTERLGQPPWRYGALTASQHAHPLGEGFSLGPLEMPGAVDTVWRGDPDGGGHGVPTLRQVADLGAPDGGVIALPTGNSGRPGNAHFADQFDSFARGEHNPWPLSPAAVAAATTQVLRLAADPTGLSHSA